MPTNNVTCFAFAVKCQMMSTTLDNLCHNLVKDGGRLECREPGERTGEVDTGIAGVVQEACSFLGGVKGTDASQKGSTGLGGDVVGKACGVDGSVQRVAWDATTEAVASGTDAGVVAGTGCHFGGFHGVSTFEQVAGENELLHPIGRAGRHG